jgi:hypothetical protein
MLRINGNDDWLRGCWTSGRLDPYYTLLYSASASLTLQYASCIVALNIESAKSAFVSCIVARSIESAQSAFVSCNLALNIESAQSAFVSCIVARSITSAHNLTCDLKRHKSLSTCDMTGPFLVSSHADLKMHRQRLCAVSHVMRRYST